MTPYHESDGVKATTMNKWTRYKDENGYWRHVYRFSDESRVEIQRDPQGGLFPWRVVRYGNDGAWCGMSPWSHFAKARNWAKFIIRARNTARLHLSGRDSGLLF